jgi:hypothetical protein
MMQSSITHGNKAAGVSQAAAITLATENAQFFDKVFEEYLIICSPDVRHVSELYNVISNMYSNMQEVIYCIL